MVTTIPQEPFKLSKGHDNEYFFDTDQPGSEGVYILSREMPQDRELNVHIDLRHTRKSQRNFGFMSAFERFGSEFETQTEINKEKDCTGDAPLIYSWSLEE